MSRYNMVVHSPVVIHGWPHDALSEPPVHPKPCSVKYKDSTGFLVMDNGLSRCVARVPFRKNNYLNKFQMYPLGVEQLVKFCILAAAVG